MENDLAANANLSELLKYLASLPEEGNGRIPTLAELSSELGVSIASLREQLEVARVMGIVEVRPKTGIKKLNYTFRPVVTTSVGYAISQDSACFIAFSDLRKHIEAAYFIEAAQLLSQEDIVMLGKVVQRAEEKMQSSFLQIPNNEHREFHLSIYKHIHNVFVTGILEAYWDLYRASGLEMYPDIDYLHRVWQYHARILDFIKQKDFVQGMNLLLEHMDLVKQREKTIPKQSFE